MHGIGAIRSDWFELDIAAGRHYEEPGHIGASDTQEVLRAPRALANLEQRKLIGRNFYKR